MCYILISGYPCYNVGWVVFLFKAISAHVTLITYYRLSYPFKNLIPTTLRGNNVNVSGLSALNVEGQMEVLELI